MPPDRWDPYEIDEMMAQATQRGGGITTSKSTTRKVLGIFNKAGWNQSFLSTHFANLNDEMLGGWGSEKQLVEAYAKYHFRKIAEETNSENIAEILKAGGLNARVANHVDVVCAPLFGSSYEFTHILDSAVEYLLGQYKPLTSKNIPYFIKPTRQNEWIPYKGKQVWSLPFTVQAPFFTIQNYIRDNIPNTNTMFYHTTNWRSLKPLFECVNHDFGRACLDFGYKSGFYMSQTLEDCVDWGKKRSLQWSNEVAILLFELPQISELVPRFTLKNLAGPEWNHIVRASRMCEKTDMRTRYLDNSYDFVYGPMMANVTTYQTMGPLTHTPPKMQLTSKSLKADEFLTEHLLGALVFRKYQG